MANYFDQFDAPAPKNYFDQFDEKPKQPAETAEQAGARYREVFKPSPAQQMFRSALMTAESIGEGANFLPLLATEGLTRGINMASSLVGGPKLVATPYEYIADHKQRLGLEPQTAAERVTNAVVSGMSGAGGLTTVAKTAAQTARGPVTKRVAESLAERPGLQAVSGASAGGAAQGANEMGFGPAGQFVAGMVGGMVPGTAAAGLSAGVRQATGSKAKQVVAKRLAETGITPEKAAAEMLPGQTLAELNRPMTDLAGAVVRRSPSAAGKVENLVEGRKAARTSELIGRIENDIARTPATTLQADDMLVAMEKQASPLYEKAYASAPKAIEIPADLAKRESVVRAYSVLQKMAKERGYVLPNIRPDAVKPIPPMGLRIADMLKRAMDDVLWSDKQPTSGIGKAQLDDMKETRALLVRAIDEQAGPEYAAARAKFAGPAQAREALELGANAHKMSAEEIARYLADPAVSEFEKQAFRIGAANQMKQRIASASDSREAANLFASPNAQQSMAQLSQEGPGFLPELVRRQRKQAAFEQQLVGGSQTQPRKSADDLLEEAMVDPSQLTFTNLLLKGLQKGKDRFVTGNQRTVKELENLLLSTNESDNIRNLARLQMLANNVDVTPYLRPSTLGALSALQLMAEGKGPQPLMLSK